MNVVETEDPWFDQRYDRNYVHQLNMRGSLSWGHVDERLIRLVRAFATEDEFSPLGEMIGS